MSATELQVTSLVNMMMQLYKRRDDKKLKDQYDLQRERYVNMSTGGDGGKAGLYGRRQSDSKRSTHEASIRELHHSAWSDEDFIKFLGELDRAIAQHHSDTGETVIEDKDDSGASDDSDATGATDATGKVENIGV